MIDWFDELSPEGRANAAKIITTAKKYGVPAEYALALARAENSDLSHNHTSNKGAIGLMQLMPPTAKELGVDPTDVDQNIDGSMRYLKKQIDANNGNLHLAAVGYNAGPNHAFFQGKADAPNESLQYVNRINQYGGFAPQTEAAPASVEEAAAQPMPVEEPQGRTYSGDAGFNAAIGAAAGSTTAPLLSGAADLVNAGMKRSAEAKAAAEAAAAKATGHGSAVRNWVPTQYAKPISDATLALKPNSEKHAADLAGFFDEGNRVVRGIPQGALPAQASPLITTPAPTPKKPDPTLWQRAKGVVTNAADAASAPTGNWVGDTAKYLGKKSLSAGLGALGLGGAALQGTDAYERAQEGDYIGAGLGGLAAVGGVASMVPHPVVKAVGLGVEGVATAGQMGYDYMRDRAAKKARMSEFDFGNGNNYAEGGMVPSYSGAKESLVKKLVGAAEGPLSRVSEYAHKVFDPRFDERVLEQSKLASLRPRVEQTGAQNVPTISLADFEGHPFITSMADRTAAGGNLIGVNGSTFNRPVALKGGQDYMFNNPGQVWASAKGPSNSILRTASALRDFTGQDPLYIPWRMAPSGGDFAHMTGQAMLAQAETGLNKTQKSLLNRQMKAIIPDWQGIDHPNSLDQFAAAPSAARKAAQNLLDKNFRDVGGLGLGEARLAVADPKQVAAPEGGLMNVGRVFSDKPLVANSGHESYPYGVPGEGLGRLDKELQVYQMLPEAAKQRGMADVMKPGGFDIRALQMKPYAGVIDDKLLKSLGY